MKNNIILTDNQKGIGFALIAAFFWGFLAIAIKITLNYVPTKTIVWFRFFFAAVFLLTLLYFRDRKALKIIISPPKLLLISALGLGFNYLGFIEGVNYTTPNNAQIFIQLGPIILAIVGFVVYKESISILQMVGFGIAGIGFALFYHEQFINMLQTSIYNRGVLWVVFGAISWSVYAVIQKILVKHHHPQHLNLINFGLPAILFIPMVDWNVLLQISPGVWLLLIFLGINTVIAYGSLGMALKYTEANKVSIILTSNPVITFIVMWILTDLEVSWIKHEIYTLLTVIGAIFVIGGAIIVSFFSKKQPKL